MDVQVEAAIGARVDEAIEVPDVGDAAKGKPIEKATLLSIESISWSNWYRPCMREKMICNRKPTIRDAR